MDCTLKGHDKTRDFKMVVLTLKWMIFCRTTHNQNIAMNIMKVFHIELILGFRDDLTIINNGLLFVFLLAQPFDI